MFIFQGTDIFRYFLISFTICSVKNEHGRDYRHFPMERALVFPFSQNLPHFALPKFEAACAWNLRRFLAIRPEKPKQICLRHYSVDEDAVTGCLSSSFTIGILCCHCRESQSTINTPLWKRLIILVLYLGIWFTFKIVRQTCLLPIYL